MVTEQQVLRFREHIVPDLERQVCELSERLSNLRQANADELSAMHERTDRAELLVAETAESLSAAKKRIALLDDMRRQAEEKAAEAEQKAQMRATEANTLIAQLRQAEEDGTARLNGVKAMLETKSTELQMALSTMCQMQQTHQAEVRQPCASCSVPQQSRSLLGDRRRAGGRSAACVRSTVVMVAYTKAHFTFGPSAALRFAFAARPRRCRLDGCATSGMKSKSGARTRRSGSTTPTASSMERERVYTRRAEPNAASKRICRWPARL